MSKSNQLFVKYIMILWVSVAIFVAVGTLLNAQDCPLKVASCIINNGSITGQIGLLAMQNGSTLVAGRVYHVEPRTALHGIHIHQFSDLGNGCNNTGGHYNPFNKTHGDVNAPVSHAGDLGNFRAIGDVILPTIFNVTANNVKLCGEYSVVGRSIVIHEDEDDLGLGGTPESPINGNSGKRIACCVITAHN